MTPYEEIIDRMIIFFTDNEFKEEALKGKNYFFNDHHPMDQDSQSYEDWMSQFHEWYLLNRKLTDKNMTPIQWAMECVYYKIVEEEREFYSNLNNATHSLFEFIKVKKDEVVVKDLFTNTKIKVLAPPIIEIFDNDEIFETRVIPNGQENVFSKSCCFHSTDATKYIKKEIKQIRKNNLEGKEDLIFKLIKMKNKKEQYSHVSVKKIYDNNSVLKI